jgi:hypothetical protein
MQLLTGAAILLAAVLLFSRLGGMPLIQPDEGRNAEVAREMGSGGSWLEPTYNGIAYLDKPGLYFRLVAWSFALFGTDEAAARLPSAVCAALLLALVYGFCRRCYGPATAALALLTVSAVPLYMVFARTVIFDMPLALCTTASVLAGFLAEENEGRARRLWYASGAACAAIATLIKGPVGFLVPGLVLAAFNLVERGAGSLRRLLAPLNLLVFFGLTLPWFLGVAARRPEFIRYGLLEETFRRYSTTSFHRTAPLYYYIPVVLGTFFPWSVLLPESAVAAWRKRRTLPAADRFFMLWAVAVVLFFSTSRSKLPGYILSAAVAGGALTARLFVLGASSARAAAVIRRGGAILAATGLVGAALLFLDVTGLASLRRLFHIRSAEFDRLRPVLLPAALLLAVVAVIALAARWKRSVRLAYAAFLLFPLGLITVAFPGLERYAQAASARALARRIERLPRDTEVACLQCFPTALPFYLRRPIVLITEDGHELTSNYVVYRIRRGEPWPTALVPLSARDRWIEGSGRPLLLLATRRSRAALDSIAARGGSAVEEMVPGTWGSLLARGAD